MRCVALFPLGNMQHFQEGFNRLSQTLFWTRVCAGSDHCPDTLGPTATRMAACALGNTPVDHDKADGLLGQVVGGFDPWRRDELEVGFSMFPKTVRQVLRGTGVRRMRGREIQLLARLLQGALKTGWRHPLSPVDDLEQPPQSVQHVVAVFLRRLVRQRREILHIPDQVGQTKLHQDAEVAHVFSVGGKVVGADDSGEFFAQHLKQHVRAARRVDLEQGVQAGPEAPRPKVLAVVFVAGLVHVQARLTRQRLEQLFVGHLQSRADLADHLGQLSGGKGHPQRVLYILLDRRVRGVTGAFQIADVGRQSRPHQPARVNLFGQRCEMN